jgi:transcriptional regulator with XRE-family HTH domain
MDQTATTAPAPGATPLTGAALHQATEAFRLELTHLRTDAGLSKKALARRMSFDPSYVSHIESGRHRPTEDFARRADDVLNSDGRLWQLWRQCDRIRHTANEGAPTPVPPPVGVAEPRSDLVVEREEATMRFDGERYTMTIRRHLHSVGVKPVARYWMKIVGDDSASAPLTWEMIDLQATCNGEPMDWQVERDQPTVKQVWLQFKNDGYAFPLYPGERAWIEYSYTVAEGTWGHWFQRAIRVPTRYLSVALRFPAELEPRVWGTETSMTADGTPLAEHPQVTQLPEDEVEWFWEVSHPQLNARYRLHWQFQARGGAAVQRAEHAERPDRSGRRLAASLNRRRPTVRQ